MRGTILRTKVLLGTHDECMRYASQSGFRRHEWKEWRDILLGHRLRGEDIIVLPSWDVVRDSLRSDVYLGFVDGLACRLERGEVLPEGI